MKKIPTLIAALLISVNLIAQVPQKLSYQAVIRNSANILIANQLVGMQISILQGSAAGTPVYVETHSPTTDINGLVTIEIGGGTPTTGSFSTIDWASGSYFVKTETDPNGNTNYSITGISQLLSVPYALYAETSGSSAGTFTHYIGEHYGGGIVFHLWKDAAGTEHGLIVDLTDLSHAKEWCNCIDSSLIDNDWDGLSNSLSIVSLPCHASSAAEICLNSTNGGQSDWYLPSASEMTALWNNCYTVSKALSQIPGAESFSQKIYWTSSEWGSSGVVLDFIFGSVFPKYKLVLHNVRAVRAF